MGTPKKKSTESFVKDIRKNTRKIFTAEQKILIVMEGLRAEIFVAELCRKHSIVFNIFFDLKQPNYMRSKIGYLVHLLPK